MLAYPIACLRGRLVVLALLGPATLVSSQSVKLSGPLAQPGTGDVLSDFQTSGSGTRIVFRADVEQDEAFGLYSAPSDGSAPAVRLDNAGDVTAFARASGNRVVYLADLTADALFVVPADGSAAPVDLSGPLVAGGNVQAFQVSPDLSRVVFRATKTLVTRIDLFSVPVDGSAPPTLLNTGPPTFSIAGSWIDPSSTFVLYNDQAQVHFRRVPIDGSLPPVPLPPPPPASCYACSQFVDAVRFTADGSQAVFQITTLDDDHNPSALFQVATDGSAPVVQLSSGDFLDNILDFALVPGAGRVFYLERVADNNPRLFTVALDGTQNLLLATTQNFRVAANGSRIAYATGGALRSVLPDGSGNIVLSGPGASAELAISPDSATVAFVRTDPATQFRGLYAVPLAGGAPAVLLNGPMLPGGLGVAPGIASLAVSADGARVVFREDRDADERFELWSVPLDAGGPPVKLSPPLGGPSDVVTFRIGPLGQRVAFLADQANDETFDLFSASIAGGSPAVRLNDPLPAGPVMGDVQGVAPMVLRRSVVYRADQDADEVVDLYSVPAAGISEPIRLTSAFAESGDVLSAVASPSERTVVFAYLTPVNLTSILYAVPARGTSTPVELDRKNFQPFAFPPAFGPDQERLVYRRGRTSTSFDLCSAPLDASAPAVTLHPPLAGSQTVSEFALATGGTSVVFRADLDVSGMVELYRVPIAGGASPVQLNGVLLAQGDVTALEVSPDGLHAAFIADAELDETFELYGVPLDGSEPPRKLNDPLPAAGDVLDVAYSSDGTRVVYRADQRMNGTTELFSAPIADVPSPRSLLLTLLPDGASAQPDFRVTSADHVLYRANPGGMLLFELFRVPIDASASPVQINGPLVPGQTVDSFALAPDQQHVVYRADERLNDVFELFGASLGGGAAVLLDTMSADGDVSDYRISPDSRFVVFRADRDADGVFELFAVPPNASAAAQRMNGPLPAGADVEPDFQAFAGGRAIYRADEEADEVFELFMGSVDLPRGIRLR